MQAANPEAAVDTPNDFAAFLWTADRLLPRGFPREPTLSADELAQIQERMVVYQQQAFLTATSLSAQDLELVATFRLFDADVSEGGAVRVFLQVVERLFRARRRVDLEGHVGSADSERDHARTAIALRGVDALSADMADVELIGGELHAE